jgi:RimJ/RimL family protein N-acetyltransferase
MILGKNVRLRALERGDLPRCLRWVNDPEIIRYTSINIPFSYEKEEQWLNQQSELSAAQGQNLAIEVIVGSDWVHIGNTGLFGIEPIHNAGEFGIIIGEKEYWNKGYGRETAKLMLKHGFEDLNLNRIYLKVFVDNLRGIKAYESAGFVKEGVMRQAMYKNGKYNDIVLMSVLHSEWKGFENQEVVELCR